MDIGTVRAEFPAADECVHLNSAARSIMPRRCIEAMTRYVETAHMIDLEKPPEVMHLPADVRSQIASLINAEPGEIALSWNTSVPLNIVAQGIPLVPGDRVVVGRSEFPANLYVWENLRRRGVEVSVLPPGKGHTTVDDVRDALDTRTRLVALSFVSFANGYRADLETIGRLCRDGGIVFVVDGIQGVGAVEIDVKRDNVDVLAAGGQKWLLSPHGTGFLYCSKAVREVLWPPFVGWLSVKGLNKFEKSMLGIPFDLIEDSRRFEIGTLAYQDLAGFRESLKIILSVGVKEIQKHIFGLLDLLVEELKKLPVEILGDLTPAHRSGIVSFVAGDTASLKRRLDSERIVVSGREGAIRVSPHLYNNLTEMEKLCRVLKAHFG